MRKKSNHVPAQKSENLIFLNQIYQIDMAPFKLNSRRNLALKQRDVYGISPVDMVVVKSLSECLMNITKLKKHLKKVGNLTDEKLMRIKKLQLMTVQRMDSNATGSLQIHRLCWF